ncbi:MAG: hypothetical protein U5Q44_04430 [Dehalococcoidia bacterium]|nr:hypothetical protein [Dehalococcoidia bacterium]
MTAARGVGRRRSRLVAIALGAYFAFAGNGGDEGGDASRGAAANAELGMIEEHRPEVGEEAPDFALLDARDGETVRRLSDYEGTPDRAEPARATLVRAMPAGDAELPGRRRTRSATTWRSCWSTPRSHRNAQPASSRTWIRRYHRCWTRPARWASTTA